ncbi:adenylate cyclase associated N terminal-domain-containing protein [Lipomyces arxii]|uniref:adenylate cyclase associated N terminal-domain-containing protein n=1 Tax=Lipomyces arxii TaxID=56418 RepID=UPI0034CE1286
MSDISNIPGYNLVTLMKRLEAATSRLEDLTVFQSQAIQGHDEAVLPSVTTADNETIPSTTPVAVSTAPAVPPAPASSIPVPEPVAVTAPVEEELPLSVNEFDNFLNEFVTPFVELSKDIDPLVKEQSEALAAAFKAQREFLRIVSKAKRPDTSSQAYIDLFTAMSVEVSKVQDIRESNRRSNFFNHLSTVSEGSPALGWIGVEPKPVPFIEDMKDSAQFYSNRVMKEFRDIDVKHVEWAQAFTKILTALQAYVRDYHTTGPRWNPKGEDVSKVAAEAVAPAPAAPVEIAAAPAPGPPPPPPPPPPASVFQVATEPAPAGGIGAVFAELNQGEAITSKLKKVDASQMTHKNPSLRTTGPVTESPTTAAASSPPSKPSKPASLKYKKPPRMMLEGTKWIVENYEGNHEIIIEAEINHGVFIHRCKDSTIQIKNKFNAVTINECSSVGLVVEDLVSGVDAIKSTRFGLQVTGKLPTITIDQCSKGEIYLSKASLDVEIYTSQSTGLNVNIPSGDEDGDYNEQYVPEQFVHKISGGKLSSSIVEHNM